MYNMHSEIDGLYKRLGLSLIENCEIRNTLNQGNIWRCKEEKYKITLDTSDKIKVSSNSPDKEIYKG